jgi:hypothetical protein
MKSATVEPTGDKPGGTAEDPPSDRVSPRVPGSEIVDGGDVRLVPGGPVELVNMSETGALVESRHRAPVGAVVTLCIGSEKRRRLPGRIARSQVCAIAGDSTMRYQLGLAFDEPTYVEIIAGSHAGSSDEAPDEEAAPPEPQVEELVNEW